MNCEQEMSFDSISRRIDELGRRIDEYNRLVARMVNPGLAEAPAIGGERSAPRPALIRETRLKEAIRETIEELEESRKAFKSKRLEDLRKKLTRVLMEG